MDTNATTTIAHPELTETLDYLERKLTRWIKRIDKWFGLCQALTDARHGVNASPAAEAAALEAWSKGRNPSKASKHNAYADAAQMNRIMGRTGHDSTVDDLRATAAAARKALGR